MIIIKIGFILLFLVVVFNFEAYANNNEVPKDIVTKVFNILKLFEKWIKIKDLLENEIFNEYFRNYGKLISRILSLMYEPNVWWLWELSILAGSTREFSKHVIDDDKTILELPIKGIKKIQVLMAVKTIKNQLKPHINNTCKFKISCLNGQGIKKHIYSELTCLENMINKFKNDGYRIEDNNNHYMPQNIYFYHIISVKKAIKSITLNSMQVTWNNVKETLLEKYNLAMKEWVGEKKPKQHLRYYLLYLFRVIAVSVYSHLDIFISSFYFQNHTVSLKNNNLWISMMKLLEKCIDIYDITTEDFNFYFIKIHKNLDKLNLDNFYKTDLGHTQDFISIQVAQSSEKIFFEYNRKNMRDILKNLNNDQLIEIAQDSYNELNQYLKTIFHLFKDVKLSKLILLLNCSPE